MTLDLSKIIGQIGARASQARTDAPAWGESLEKAEAALTAADPSTLARRIESAGVGFAWQGIAGLVGDIKGSYAPSDPPPNFTVVASDGSHIEPERHHPANCFLLNIGAASFRYGQDASAELTSEPTLFYGDDLALPITKAGVRREPIEGAILGMKRTVA
ncbi:MAG: hypothetical protein HY677_00300, partial [Chloroflexi bacterium]|nr:hypothetical protein [Chloroflexota bacterium]